MPRTPLPGSPGWMSAAAPGGAAPDRDRYEPRSLTGVDVIDWLAGDLRDEVRVLIGAAEDELGSLDPVDGS